MVLDELPMVELHEVAEGVREHLDHPVSRWDQFISICNFNYRKIAYVLAIFCRKRDRYRVFSRAYLYYTQLTLKLTFL